MSQRKLTKRQLWRINKIQTEKKTRFNKKLNEQVIDEKFIKNEVLTGQIVQNFGHSYLLQKINPQNQVVNETIYCTSRQHVGHLVAGDLVHWQQIENQNESKHTDLKGIIVALIERKSLLSRPDHLGHKKPIAANIDQVFIVTAPDIYSKNTIDKMINIRLVDRYLIICENNQLKPIIVINKMDLFDHELIDELEQLLLVYRDLDYQILFTSVNDSIGLDLLEQDMRGSKSIFVGQSGMGKSSLLNQLIPQAQAKIAEISVSSGKGKHTTSSAVLYDLNALGISGGFIIDSPGIRELGLWKLDKPSIHQGFKEIEHFAQQCKFRDCQHENEPSCAVLDALDSGEISEFRFISYQNIITSLI